MEEATTLVDWAKDVRVNEALLSMTLTGEIEVDIRDGEAVFLCGGKR